MNFLKYLDCCYKFYDDCCNDRLYIPDAKGCLHKAKIYYEPWGEPIGFFFTDEDNYYYFSQPGIDPPPTSGDDHEIGWILHLGTTRETIKHEALQNYLGKISEKIHPFGDSRAERLLPDDIFNKLYLFAECIQPQYTTYDKTYNSFCPLNNDFWGYNMDYKKYEFCCRIFARDTMRWEHLPNGKDFFAYPCGHWCGIWSNLFDNIPIIGSILEWIAIDGFELATKWKWWECKSNGEKASMKYIPKVNWAFHLTDKEIRQKAIPIYLEYYTGKILDVACELEKVNNSYAQEEAAKLKHFGNMLIPYDYATRYDYPNRFSWYSPDMAKDNYNCFPNDSRQLAANSNV